MTLFFYDKQACAFGPGRVSLLSFDGDSLDVTPIEDVGGPDGFHFLLADLGAGKDTVRILRDLQAAYPKATTDEYERLHELLGSFNAKTCAAAVDAMASDRASLFTATVPLNCLDTAGAAPGRWRTFPTIRTTRSSGNVTPAPASAFMPLGESTTL